MVPTIAGIPPRVRLRVRSSRFVPARRPTATSALIMARTPRSKSSPTPIDACQPPRRPPETPSNCRHATATCFVCGGSTPGRICFICARTLEDVPPSRPPRVATSSICETATMVTACRGGSTTAIMSCSRAIVASVSSGTLKALGKR